jgi:hypothetical protein
MQWCVLTGSELARTTGNSRKALSVCEQCSYFQLEMPPGLCSPVSVLDGHVLLHPFHQVPEALGEGLLLGGRLGAYQTCSQLTEVLMGDKAVSRLALHTWPQESNGPKADQLRLFRAPWCSQGFSPRAVLSLKPLEKTSARDKARCKLCHPSHKPILLEVFSCHREARGAFLPPGRAEHTKSHLHTSERQSEEAPRLRGRTSQNAQGAGWVTEGPHLSWHREPLCQQLWAVFQVSVLVGWTGLLCGGWVLEGLA